MPHEQPTDAPWMAPEFLPMLVPNVCECVQMHCSCFQDAFRSLSYAPSNLPQMAPDSFFRSPPSGSPLHHCSSMVSLPFLHGSSCTICFYMSSSVSLGGDSSFTIPFIMPLPHHNFSFKIPAFMHGSSLRAPSLTCFPTMIPDVLCLSHAC